MRFKAMAVVVFVWSMLVGSTAWGATEKSGLIYYPADGTELSAMLIKIEARGLPAGVKITYTSGASNPYYITSGCTVPDFVTLEIEEGAIIDENGADFIVSDPSKIKAHPTQQIFADPITFLKGGIFYAGWWGVINDGDGAGAGTDNSNNMQKVFNSARTVPSDGSSIVELEPGFYRFDSAVTWQRAGTAEPEIMILEGNGAVLDFSNLTGSAIGLTFGATALTNYIQLGLSKITNLDLKGPENPNPQTADTTTTTVGLFINYAGQVELESVASRQFYTGIKTLYTFPLIATHTDVARNGIGLHLDEVSNEQIWNGVDAARCRYGILLDGQSTSEDDGKIFNITINTPHFEQGLVGMVIDSGDNSSIITPRGIKVNSPYISNLDYDFFRLAHQFNYATPETRGDNSSGLAYDIELNTAGGILNPTGSEWEGGVTQYCVSFGGNRVRQFQGYFPTDYTGVTAQASTLSDAFLGEPRGGVLKTSGLPDGTGDKQIETRYYDETGFLSGIESTNQGDYITWDVEWNTEADNTTQGSWGTTFWTVGGTSGTSDDASIQDEGNGQLWLTTDAADNDSVFLIGPKIFNFGEDIHLETRFKNVNVDNAYIAVGFVTTSFADKGTLSNDMAVVGIDTDNAHGFSPKRFILTTNDNGAGAIVQNCSVNITGDTWYEIRMDFSDIDQPRVWINDNEVDSANITGTIQDATKVAPYIMVQGLSAAEDRLKMDYMRVWQNRDMD